MQPSQWTPQRGGVFPNFDLRWPVGTRLKSGGFIGEFGVVESTFATSGGLNQIIWAANQLGAGLPYITRATPINRAFFTTLVSSLNAINIAAGFSNRVIASVPNKITYGFIQQLRQALNDYNWTISGAFFTIQRDYPVPPLDPTVFIETNTNTNGVCAFDGIWAGVYANRGGLFFTVPSGAAGQQLKIDWVEGTSVQNTDAGVLPYNGSFTAYVIPGPPAVTFNMSSNGSSIGSFPNTNQTIPIGVLAPGDYAIVFEMDGDVALAMGAVEGSSNGIASGGSPGNSVYWQA